MLTPPEDINTDNEEGASDDPERLVSFEPRVVRHWDASGHESFAIHEVYLNARGEVATMTVQALSVRTPTVSALQQALLSRVASGNQTFRIGDLNYEYDREDIEDWLSAFELPILDALS